MRVSGRFPILLLVWLALGTVGRAHAQGSPVAQSDEPRAYGYQVGDVVTRRFTIDAPAGLALDEASLPAIGRMGHAFELRRREWTSERSGPGQRHRLLLEYQVFVAPTAVRTLELPPVVLRWVSAKGAQDLRLDAWPVTVAPLVPVDVSPRTGLGEMQPDAPPPLLDTGPATRRMAVLAALAVPLLLYLLHVYVGLPWLARRQRPFAQAWQALRRVPERGDSAARRAAYAHFHEALNRSAGGALFEPGLDAFLAAQPRYAALREDLRQFFQRSRQEFFAQAPNTADSADPVPWLRELSRRARDAERGSA